MDYSGFAIQWDQFVLRGDPRSRVRGLMVGGNSVSSSGTNVDVWDVNEQLKALIRSRRAVDGVMLVDPDAPLESLMAEEEPSDAR